MELDPQMQAVLDAFAAMGLAPPDTLPVADARKQFLAARSRFVARPEPLPEVRELDLDGPAGPLPARLYRPSVGGSLPALVYFHGGGWVFGNLDSHDALCRSLARASGCAVVSVDYRLAPEHRFPAAVEDALAAVRAVAARHGELGVDPARLAVGGDSAGGNLAAVTALEFRDGGGPPLAAQVLLYAVTDLSLESPSYQTLGRGYLLTHERMRYFRDCYLEHPAVAADWRASPLRATDFSRLPPALVITASHDPLVGEGQAYAERLAAAGVPVHHECHPGVVHGFMTMAGALDAGRRAVDATAAWLRTRLAA